MSFRNFLCEEFKKNNRCAVVIQHLLDNLDDSHIQYSTSKIKGNVGQIIQKGNLSNLYLVIKHDDSKDFSARLGKEKSSDNYAIVVCTPNSLPERQKIDSFIAENDEVYKGIHDCLNKFFNMSLQNNDNKTESEKIKEMNTPESFESGYQAICDEMSGKIKHCRGVMSKLAQQVNASHDESKKQTVQMAIKNVLHSTIGKSNNEFYNLATKNHKDFVNSLDKTYLKKLKERLKNYYEQL